MAYSKYPYKLVNLKLVHHNCWTNYISENTVIRSLGRSYYDGTLRALVVVSSKSIRKLYELKKEGKIEDILNVQRYGDNYIIDIVQKYKDSILSVLNKYEAIILETVKTNRREFWSFVTYDFKIPKIIEELKGISTIEKIKVSDYDPTRRELSMSDMELKCLIYAAKLGYFDYPKRANVKEMAKVLGISEVMFLYYLRRAQRKLVEKLLNDLNIYDFND
jgi:predicted DNA binding protein